MSTAIHLRGIDYLFMSCQRHTTIFALYPEDIFTQKPDETDWLPLSVFVFEKSPHLLDSYIFYKYRWLFAAAITLILCFISSCKLRVFRQHRIKMLGGLASSLPGQGKTSKADGNYKLDNTLISLSDALKPLGATSGISNTADSLLGGSGSGGLGGLAGGLTSGSGLGGLASGIISGSQGSHDK